MKHLDTRHRYDITHITQVGYHKLELLRSDEGIMPQCVSVCVISH